MSNINIEYFCKWNNSKYRLTLILKYIYNIVYFYLLLFYYV